jgi:hypothetical protein
MENTDNTENTETLQIKITEVSPNVEIKNTELLPVVKEEPKKEKKPRKPLSEESKLKRAETLKKAREAKKQINQLVKKEVGQPTKELKTVEQKAQEKLSLLKKTEKVESTPKEIPKPKKTFEEKLRENAKLINNVVEYKLNEMYNKKSLRNFF